MRIRPSAGERSRNGGRSVGGEQFVFNLVWTEGAFEYLGLFTLTLLAHSGARFRFVCNGCQPDEIERMERFANLHPDRIADIVVVSADDTLRHGDALDEVRERCDDGDHFCLIDPDILATGEFLGEFASAMASHAAVTSGRELWSDDNVLPEGHPGLNGEYFHRADGYLYGSPHFAIYDAAALGDTIERWGVGFGEGGSGLSQATRQVLRSGGHDYLLYDTGKLVNILLQEDGHTITHSEHDDLVHVGGLLHYLWAPRVAAADGTRTVDWANWRGMTARHEVARYTAAVLRELLAGRPAPTIPQHASEAMVPRLELVRTTMSDVVARHGEGWLETIGRGPGPESAASTSYNAMRRMAPARPGRSPTDER